MENKSHMSKKIPKMPTLIKNGNKNEIKKIINLKNKMKFLYDEFFFTFFSIIFSDISKAIYSTRVNCFELVIKQKMKQTMR